MFIKKNIGLFIPFFSLIIYLIFAYGGSEQEVIEVLFTNEVRDEHKNAAVEIIESYYWKYDETTFDYYMQLIPSKFDEKFYNIHTVCEKSGYNLSDYAGKEALVVSVNLNHYNEEQAGKAYVYFINYEPIATYYEALNGKNFALTERNTYLRDTKFLKYETDEKNINFNQHNTNFAATNIVSDGKDIYENSIFLSIEDDKVNVYKFNNDIYIYKSLSFNYLDMIPISATFYKNNNYEGDCVAILLGTYEEIELGESISTQLMSKKIIFLDNNYNILQQEVLLDNEAYSCITFDDGEILLLDNKNLDRYTYDNDSLKKIGNYSLSHGGYSIKIVDLDSNGTKEYLITDGRDFYMYQKTSFGFFNIWKTNISIESINGYIQVADLNNDSVMEIYVQDTTGTTVKYIVTENGLKSQNDDIIFGEKYFVMDFNNDGISDYVSVIEGYSKALYLSSEYEIL